MGTIGSAFFSLLTRWAFTFNALQKIGMVTEKYYLINIWY